MSFKKFANLVNKNFMAMQVSGNMLKVNAERGALWNKYQGAFPSGTNEIFRERKEHECNTCYAFIKKLGSVITVNEDGSYNTIWDVVDAPAPYDVVAEQMSAYIKSHDISGVFLTDEALAGREFNIEENVAGNIRWDHFYATVDPAFIVPNVAETRGGIESTVSVFGRALNEFSVSDLDIVIDLCGSIYKGEEFQPTVSKFKQAKIAYEASANKSAFLWTQYKNYPSKIRNSAIGTLIVDVSTGVELDDAVKKYEAVVAPANYKRTSAVVTPRMKAEAVKKIDELGLRNSLARRHATLTDISINNVLFSSSSASAVMKDALDMALDAIKAPTKVPTKEQEISIENFLADVLPNSNKVEALVENSHLGNMVSLVAPKNDAKNILKWNNNFSWSYKGEVTDSMKEKVKSAGGNVDGYLRFSIQWNEDGRDSSNDLDAHCKFGSNHIYYGNSRVGGGELDVDITHPGTRTAVENITFPSRDVLKTNVWYEFKVVNFSGSNTCGFRAQIEVDGEIFEYNKPQGSGVVARVKFKADGSYEIEHTLPSTSTQRTEWEVTTKEYREVSTVMLSPNHWDGQAIGNKHYFFMLDGCNNPNPVRGFYNEFLMQDLTPHRKTFEALSANMLCEPAKEQLSGLGFSSTMRNEVSVKVDNVPYRIKF